MFVSGLVTNNDSICLCMINACRLIYLWCAYIWLIWFSPVRKNKLFCDCIGNFFLVWVILTCLILFNWNLDRFFIIIGKKIIISCLALLNFKKNEKDLSS